MKSSEAIETIVSAKRDDRPQLVTISGGTCSGKSTFKENLQRGLHIAGISVATILLDEYFLDLSDRALPRQNGKPVFDLPGAYHYDEFIRDARRLCKGERIDMPRYNMTRNERTYETTPVEPGKVIVAEGLFATSLLYGTGKLNRYQATHVYMDTPIETCLNRRIARDMSVYKIPESAIRNHWEKQIFPFWGPQQLNQKRLATIIVREQDERS